MHSKQQISRRAILGAALATPVVIAGCAGMTRDKAGLAGTERPLVQADDPVARSVAYYPDTRDVPADNPLATNHDISQKCSNCVHRGESAGEGGISCGTFPGRRVSVDGWCTIWAKA